MTETQRILSGVKRRWSVRGAHPKRMAGLHLRTLTRFMGGKKRGRPSHAALRDRHQLKFGI